MYFLALLQKVDDILQEHKISKPSRAIDSFVNIIMESIIEDIKQLDNDEKIRIVDGMKMKQDTLTNNFVKEQTELIERQKQMKEGRE